jgi:hypothetical protein
MPARHDSQSSSWRVAAFVLAAFFLLLVARFWHPVYGFSRFIQLDSSNDEAKITAFKTLPIYVYRNTGGYDGLYYAQIANDPSLSNPELTRATDNLGYRARRILPAALAWLLAGGKPAWIVQVYSLLNVAAWLCLALLLWRLLEVGDVRSLLAWSGVLFSAGALESVRFALTDLVALAILAGAMLGLERARTKTAIGLLAAAALARETSLLGLTGLIGRPWLSLRNLIRVFAVSLPLLAWLAYIRWRTGPANPGWGNFALPFAGFIGKWRDDLIHSFHPNPDHRWLIWTTLLTSVGLTAQTAYLLARPQWTNPWWRIGTSYVVLMLFLGTAVWEGFPGAATRVLLPLTLAFNVLATRSRAPISWLLVGNVGLVSGLLILSDVHHDPREMAAARLDGIAVIAREDQGWYGVEHTSRHTWSWSDGSGDVSIEAWPKVGSDLRLEFALRSLTPCQITVRQDGVLVWQGRADANRATVSLPFTVRDGYAHLVFATDVPSTPENSDPGARPLAFAVYDVQLKKSENPR